VQFRREPPRSSSSLRATRSESPMLPGSHRTNDLISRIRAGDRAACEEFVRREYSAVYRFLRYLTNNSESAADLTQETFQTAWERLEQFHGRSTVASWLHRIAYNKFVDARRRLQLDRAWQDRQRSKLPVRQALSPADAACANENSERLYEAVTQLPQEQRTVIVLHYFQSLSLRETAEVLGEPVGTVKWRASAALQVLRDTSAISAP
jgi:RNA polymerase sigma-70 factor, ECF subfamily